MTTDELLGGVARRAASFEPISLAEMEHVRLMNRTEAKFLLPAAWLPGLLTELRPHYRLLAIEGNPLCAYRTLYFDTVDLELYHQHRRGQGTRYKIRQRYYVSSDLAFTEVKCKNHKGRTAKSRIRSPHRPGAPLDAESKTFLAAHAPLDPDALLPRLWVDYTRLTLVSRVAAERLTLDLNLTFRADGAPPKSYPRLVIAEVKRESLGHSRFLPLMKGYRLPEGGLSKYCLGIISLGGGVPHNRFKPQLRHLHHTITRA